ncbi:MAG TPA: hypothetical protein VGO67_19815 [Verrucomicrobiae bacterium]
MLRVFIFCFLFATASAWAGEGKVLKVLPQLLDKEGRHALSPSLYERDAYQFILRRAPSKQAALRLAIQWKAKKVDPSKLKLRAEMRGLLGDKLGTVTIEEPVKKPGYFSNWSEVKLEGDKFHKFGQLVAWRVSLWEGDKQLSQMQSFLWSGVTTN